MVLLTKSLSIVFYIFSYTTPSYSYKISTWVNTPRWGVYSGYPLRSYLQPTPWSIIQKRVQHPLFSLGPQGSCQQGRSTQLTGPEWPLEVQTHPETKHLAYQPRLTLQVSSSFVSRWRSIRLTAPARLDCRSSQ